VSGTRRVESALRVHRSARASLISRGRLVARLISAFTDQSRAPGAPACAFGSSVNGH
jgi:hypothetical protein